jgi:hypothetical protein
MTGAFIKFSGCGRIALPVYLQPMILFPPSNSVDLRSQSVDLRSENVEPTLFYIGTATSPQVASMGHKDDSRYNKI